MINWATAAPAIGAAFLASIVEVVEAFTIVLAVATLRGCKIQRRVDTPRAVWNPDVPNPVDYYASWQDVPDEGPFDNAFKVQWERFLLHVATDAPFPHDFCEGAKGVQLAELALQSWDERRWVDVPPVT